MMTDRPALPPNPFRRAWPLFALGTAIGLFWLVQIPFQAARDYRTLTRYQPTQSRVLSARAIKSTTWSNVRGATWTTRETFSPEVTFAYQVQGRSYTAVGYDNYDGRTTGADVLALFRPNATVPCWYDPERPEQAVVARTFSRAYYVSGLIPLALTVIPANFLVLALRRRPATVRIATSAGTTHPVRLTAETTHREALAIQLTAAVLIAAGIVVYVGYTIRAGGLVDAIGGFGFFFLLAAGFDGYLFWLAWGSADVARLPSPIVEVDRDTVRAGETLAMEVRIPGPIAFRDLEVTLGCDTQGGRRAHKPVRQRVFNEASGEVASNDWYTHKATVHVPADARPSERTVDSLTTWTIEVRLKRVGGGTMAEEFPIRVVGTDRDTRTAGA
jgi:uncharacterized protein DUF3592